MDLSGVFVPAVTPFSTSGEIALDAFRSNAADWLAHPVRGLVVGGSTGEAVLLDEEERRRLWEAGRDALGADRLLIAGTGAESTRATIRLTALAARSGADAVLVQPPAFYRGAMGHVALATHYRAVADASPVPVIVYQVPLRLSTLDLAAELVAELARHENVAGIKDSRGSLEQVEALVAATRDQAFQVLVGNGAILQEALGAGAVGGILGVANVVPGASAGILMASAQGRTAEAASLQAEVAPLHQGIVGQLGVPGVKYALDVLGLRGGDPRPPLRPLNGAGRATVRELLANILAASR